MPITLICLFLGVSQRATVNLTDEPSCNSSNDWTEPLPKVFSPTNCAKPKSCKAPATISEADAEPPLTKIKVFKFLNWAWPLAKYGFFSPPVNSSCTTTCPGSSQY